MTVIKQKTVNTADGKLTIKLYQLKNDMPQEAIGFSGKYKYEIRNSYGGTMGETYNNKREAEKAFKNLVNKYSLNSLL